jgi:hypothetical protein
MFDAAIKRCNNMLNAISNALENGANEDKLHRLITQFDGALTALASWDGYEKYRKETSAKISSYIELAKKKGFQEGNDIVKRLNSFVSLGDPTADQLSSPAASPAAAAASPSRPSPAGARSPSQLDHDEIILGAFRLRMEEVIQELKREYGLSIPIEIFQGVFIEVYSFESLLLIEQNKVELKRMWEEHINTLWPNASKEDKEKFKGMEQKVRERLPLYSKIPAEVEGDIAFRLAESELLGLYNNLLKSKEKHDKETQNEAFSIGFAEDFKSHFDMLNPSDKKHFLTSYSGYKENNRRMSYQEIIAYCIGVAGEKDFSKIVAELGKVCDVPPALAAASPAAAQPQPQPSPARPSPAVEYPAATPPAQPQSPAATSPVAASKVMVPFPVKDSQLPLDFLYSIKQTDATESTGEAVVTTIRDAVHDRAFKFLHIAAAVVSTVIRKNTPISGDVVAEINYKVFLDGEESDRKIGEQIRDIAKQDFFRLLTKGRQCNLVHRPNAQNQSAVHLRVEAEDPFDNCITPAVSDSDFVGDGSFIVFNHKILSEDAKLCRRFSSFLSKIKDEAMSLGVALTGVSEGNFTKLTLNICGSKEKAKEFYANPDRDAAVESPAAAPAAVRG